MNPEYITPDAFAIKEWWKPLRPGVQWFYHTPRNSTKNTVDINTVDINTVDINTVDEQLKPIVRFCIDHRIRTLPSCAGHDVHEEYSQRLFHQLQHDAQNIQQNGLSFENVETGHTVFVRDPAYTLPWKHWLDLHAHLHTYERMGVIGFVFELSNPVHTSIMLKLKHSCMCDRRDFQCIMRPIHKMLVVAEVWVSCDTLKKQHEVWKRVHNEVFSL